MFPATSDMGNVVRQYDEKNNIYRFRDDDEKTKGEDVVGFVPVGYAPGVSVSTF